MKIVSIAILILALFIAVWFFFVAPAEKRHHERKLAALQKKIESRQTSNAETSEASSTDLDSDNSGDESKN